MKKIKVGIVNYLNTAPLVHGLQKSDIASQIELRPDYPSNLARSLLNDDIDMGLVPVAAIPQLEQWWLIGDYCIGAEGEVASVCLFSEVPLQEITRVLLDYQSRTSVELAKILIEKHWKLDVTVENASDGFEREIAGSTAAVVIGDRALRQRKISAYSYDLAAAWMEFTKLPFVFAAWVSNKPLEEEFIRSFNQANELGVRHISDVIGSIDNSDKFDLEEYFNKYISYQLDARKKMGLQKFLNFLDPNITLSM